jgi:N-methylhydantoinase B
MSYELNRKLAARRDPLPTSVTIDQVTADIIRGAFETVCFESCTFLGRAASSPIINQSNERNAAIVDAHGRLAMGAVGTPQLTFVNQMETRWGLMNMDRYGARATCSSATTPITAAAICPTTASTAPSTTTRAN